MGNRITVKFFMFVAIVLVIAGCDEKYHYYPEDYIVGPENIDDYLVLSTSAESLPADGFSRVTVGVTIAFNADHKTIEFETSEGQLVGTGMPTDNNGIITTADASGRAIVELQSSQTVGTVLVKAMALKTEDDGSGHTEEILVTRQITVEFVPPNPDDILTLHANPSSIPADGFSRTTLEARVNPNANTRTITFTTSDGTLRGPSAAAGGTNTKIEITADASGRAIAQLQSSTTVGTVLVQAEVTIPEGLPIARQIEVVFGPVSSDDILTLDADPSSIPADGFSRTTLEARVNPNANNTGKIKFTTSDGELFGPGADTGGATIEITTDASGRAIAQLQSSTRVGTALVQAEVTPTGGTPIARQIEVDFVPVEPSDIIVVSASASKAPADGATVTNIFADIAPGLISRTVTFSTTLGVLSPTSNDADSSNRATVGLTSPNEVGTAFITATVDDFSGETRVEFVRALPDSVIVVPADTSVSAGGKIHVDVNLLRSIGTVTLGTVVEFSATDDSGNTFGIFLPSVVEINDDGKSAETTFDPGDTLFRGIATIKAKVGGVKGEAEIEIIN